MVDISYSASGKIAMLRQYARRRHRGNGAARFDPSVFAFGKLKRRQWDRLMANAIARPPERQRAAGQLRALLLLRKQPPLRREFQNQLAGT